MREVSKNNMQEEIEHGKRKNIKKNYLKPNFLVANYRRFCRPVTTTTTTVVVLFAMRFGSFAD